MNSLNRTGGARPGLAECTPDGQPVARADLEVALARLRALGRSVGTADSHERRAGELKDMIGEARRALALSAAIESGGEVPSGVVGRATPLSSRPPASALTPSEWLVRSVVHDLNNMLLVIQNCSESLAHQASSAVQREAGVVQDAAAQAARLIAKLLPSDARIGRPAGVDLSDCVRRFTGVIGALVGEQIEVRTDLARVLPLARCEETAIFRVLSNLAANARDAMPAGGRLMLRTREVPAPLGLQRPPGSPESYVLLMVEDTGEGMDSATSDRAFEPFFTTKRPGKGTGVGLTAVREIVQSFGGFVHMASEPARGTTVSLHFEGVRAPA